MAFLNRTYRSFDQTFQVDDLVNETNKMIGYIKVKDLFYFKNLIRLHDIAAIKEILPLIVETQT